MSYILPHPDNTILLRLAQFVPGDVREQARSLVKEVRDLRMRQQNYLSPWQAFKRALWRGLAFDMGSGFFSPFFNSPSVVLPEELDPYNWEAGHDWRCAMFILMDRYDVSAQKMDLSETQTADMQACFETRVHGGDIYLHIRACYGARMPAHIRGFVRKGEAFAIAPRP